MTTIHPFKLSMDRPDLANEKSTHREVVFKLTFADDKEIETIATMTVKRIIFPNEFKGSPGHMENYIVKSPYFPSMVTAAICFMESFYTDPTECSGIPELVGIHIVI